MLNLQTNDLNEQLVEQKMRKQFVKCADELDGETPEDARLEEFHAYKLTERKLMNVMRNTQ